ncbi:GILT-like protein 1 [Contarinia nasturtii]|uniref:GILT-like protein 1 n=1 Tax=Contarinia nasturtii TaxID=265458 RepID=UPI0012D4B619|nr:GILT-like protein 1 [Contarinia nasturtii]
MKFCTITVLVVLIVATVAHPPGASEHDENHQHHEHESNDNDEKPITEAAVEGRSVNETRLPVTIYYEGLCPDSRKLMADFGREYYSFKNYISLKFIPFGRAESLDSDGNEFKCHHGPKECVANRIHSCGIQYLTSQDAKQQFVVCQMRTEADQTGKECLSEAGGNWSEVSECINGNEGKQLQLQAEKDTKRISVPRLENVPTIVFNDELSTELNKEALTGLKPVFCKLLSEKNIPDC